jgi:hypothetical protein
MATEMAVTLLEAMRFTEREILQPAMERMVFGAPAERTPSGHAWTCKTGKHRYHRDRDVARQCAFIALPMGKVPI